MYYTTHEVAKRTLNFNSARTLLKALGDNQDAKGKARKQLKNLKVTKKLAQELLEKLENNKLSQIWNCRTKEGKGWYYKKDIINQILKGK